MQKSFKRRIVKWIIGLTVLALLILSGSRVVVEHEVQKYAAIHGMDIRFEGMNVGWFTLELLNVKAKVAKNVQIEAEVDSVLVGVGSDFRPRSVTIRGGTVHAKGDGGGEGESGGGGETGQRPGPDLKLEELNVSWSGDAGVVEARDVSLERKSGSVDASAKEIIVERGKWRAQATDVKIRKERKVVVTAKTITIEKTPGVQGKELPEPKTKGAIHALPPIPFDVSVEVSAIEVWGATSNPIMAEGVVSSAMEGENPTYSIQLESLVVGPAQLKKLQSKVSWDGSSGRMNMVANELSYQDKHIGHERTRLNDASMDADLSLTDEASKVEVSLNIGATKLSVDVEARQDGIVNMTATLPDQECQTVIDSLPVEMKTVVQGIKASGRIGLDLRIKSMTGADPKVELKLRNSCKILETPSRTDVKLMSGPFETSVIGSDGGVKLRKTGPGTGSWTKIDLMSQYMPLAVMATEDPGFRSHHGFSVKAIENSLAMDLKERRFVRGASTISMQLAKNLWLNREKSASRKIQEAILTTYLEQRLPKEKIMELYLNVVEFAPGVYGVKDGAQHWFSTDPWHLTLTQSVVLALQLPNPKASPFGPDGRMTPTKWRIVKTVIQGMKGAGMITEEEMSRAVKEEPMRGEPQSEVSEDETLDIKEWE